MTTNKFPCTQCGQVCQIAEDADLDFESCDGCGATGDWDYSKKTTTSVSVQEGKMLPANTENLSAKDIFEDSKIKEVVAWVKAESDKHEPDTSSKKGRDAIASNSRKVSSTKVILEKIATARKAEIKKDSEAEVLVIQTGLKYMIAELETLRDEKRQPLTDWEEEEKARVAAEELAVEIEHAHGEAIAENDLFDRQREVERKEAKIAKAEEESKANEAEAKRLEEEKAAKEAEEKERGEREEIIRKKAAAQAEADKQKAIQDKKDAEAKAKREKKEAAELAEREKIEAVAAAERKAKEEAEQKERDRLAKEKADKAVAEKKAANKKHRAKIDAEIKKYLIGLGMDDFVAGNLVQQLAAGKVPHTTINY